MNNIRMYFYKELKKVSLLTFLLKIAIIPIDIFTAGMISKVISASTNGDIEQVLRYAIILLIVLIIFNFFHTLVSITTEHLSTKSVHKCRMILYKKFLEQPLHILYKLKSGDTNENLKDDFNHVSSLSLQLYPNLIVSIIIIIVYIGFFLYYGPFVALALSIIALIQVLPPVIVKKYLNRLYITNREIEAKLTNFTIAGYHGLSEIKLFDLRNWYMSKLRDLNKQEIKVGTKSVLAFNSQQAMNNLVEYIIKYGTYGILGIFVLYRYINLEEAISVIVLSKSFYMAVKTTFGLIPDFGVARIATERLDKYFEEHPAYRPLNPNNKIIMKQLSFDYVGKQIFFNVSETIPFDKITFIYGENGKGKSTLMKCLLGLLPSTNGKIYLDSIDPLNISNDYFHETILYLPQHDEPLKMTASELYDVVEPSSSEVCKQNAFDFDLSESLLNHHTIDELSGGQRKKVFLALAFGVRRKLLLLDEPTNSLDKKGKEVFIKKLVERGKGTVIITHDQDLQFYGEDIFICNGGLIRNEKV